MKTADRLSSHPLHARLHAFVARGIPDDRFALAEAGSTDPRGLGLDRHQISDEAFLTLLYRELLGREPDEWGFQHHLRNLRQGTAREFVHRAFLASPEYRASQLSRTVGSEPEHATAQVPAEDPEAESGSAIPPIPPASARAPIRDPEGPRPVVASPPERAPTAEKIGARPLRLSEYPKAHPAGAHGIPNYLQDMDDVGFVLDRLGRVGARNTLLIVPFPSPAELRDVDRAFLEGAKARGITVQLRLGWNFAGPGAAMKPPLMGVDPAQLRRYTEQVAAVLGHGPYIQIGNEPNLHHEWHEHSIDAGAFARWWARYGEAVAAGGGYPGLPGMAAGAWDVPDGSARNEFGFHREILQALVREAPRSLDRAWFGAHPYHMYADAGHPDFVEDAWWQLREYDRIHREVAGRSLPILVTESGYVDGPNARRLDPGNASQAADVARFKRSLADRPDWLVVGAADWLISNRHGSGQWKAIYGPNGEPSAWSNALEAGRDGWAFLEDSIRR